MTAAPESIPVREADVAYEFEFVAHRPVLMGWRLSWSWPFVKAVYR